MSKHSLLSEKNKIAVTLQQIYETNAEIFHLFYNDQEPPCYQNSSRESSGHMKGVINFDKNGGYWLIHSIPYFPFDNAYKYCRREIELLQSFICVSLKYQDLETIVDQLLMMNPNVYSTKLTPKLSTNKDLIRKMRWLMNNKPSPIKEFHILNLQTVYHMNLTHFGKAQSFNYDLYSKLMAPYLKQSLLVETWKKGYEIPSSCQQEYKVYNINEILINSQIEKYTRDHSKWAISYSITNPFVCIGDVNRMTSQFKRGGGSLCIYDKSLWKAFYNIVNDYEKCIPNH